MILEKNPKFLLIAIFICLFDQITKFLAVTYLQTHQEIHITSQLSFFLLYNESTIFSDIQLHQWPFEITLYQFKVFYITLISLLMALVLWLNKTDLKELGKAAVFVRIGMLFLVAGGLGNVLDQAFRPQGVVDFIKINSICDKRIRRIVNINHHHAIFHRISIKQGVGEIILNV